MARNADFKGSVTWWLSLFVSLVWRDHHISKHIDYALSSRSGRNINIIRLTVRILPLHMYWLVLVLFSNAGAWQWKIMDLKISIMWAIVCIMYSTTKQLFQNFTNNPLNNNDFYSSLRVEESDRDYQLNMSLKRPLQHNVSCLEIGLQYM